MEEFDNERQILFNRFRTSLSDRAEQYFFDEDDIVEIFDYSGDLGNDFIRAEALMYGARYFPDSDRLRQRRALFYSDIFETGSVTDIEEVYGEDPGLLGQLSIIRMKSWPKERAREQLSRLLDEAESMDDEEIIRFVGVADEYGLLEWIDEIMPQLEQKTSNRAALIYEMAYSYQQANPDRAAQLLEQLVELKPYVADYWQMLAGAQLNSTLYTDKVNESLDMALALDPDNKEAWLLKARIIGMSDNPSEYHELMSEIYERMPLMPDVILTYLHTMDDETLKNIGANIVVKYISQSDFISMPIYESLLLIDPEQGLRCLDMVLNAPNISITDFEPVIWRVAAVNAETANSLCDFLLIHAEDVDLNSMLLSMALAMFVYANFKASVRYTDELIKMESVDKEVMRHVSLIRAISFYKLYQFDRALDEAQRHLQFDQPEDSDNFPSQNYWQRLNFVGSETCAHVITNLCSPEGRINNNPDDFTFAGLWSE